MATLPGAFDFHVKAGAAWTETIVWKIDGVTVDPTGYTIDVRIITLTGTTHVAGSVNPDKSITWTVPRATVDANVGFSTYDICAYSGDGTPNWLLAGTLEVTA